MKLALKNTNKKTVIIFTSIEISSDTKKANINIAIIADGIIIAKKRADTNIVSIASKSTKKRADAKIVVIANELATTNINKSANNIRKKYNNIMTTANTNITPPTNKIIKDGRKVHTNMMVSSNGNNTKRARINKVVTVNKDDAKNTYQHSQ